MAKPKANTDKAIALYAAKQGIATDEQRGMLSKSELQGAQAEAYMARRQKHADEQAAAESASSDGGASPSPSGAADRMRERGSGSARAGLATMREADRKVSFQVANKNYGAVKGYTDAMQGDAPVARGGRFQAARAGLAQLGAPAPAAPAPVQVVVQAPGATAPPPPAPQAAAAPPAPAGPQPLAVPAGAIGRAPGELPPAAMPPVPLEGEPPPDETPEQQLARLEAEASMTPEQLEAQAAADYGPMEGTGEAEAPPPKAGIMQRQMDAEEEASNARVGMAQAEADAMADASAKYQDSLAQAEAAKAEQDAAVAEQLAATEEATKLVERTSKEAIDSAAIDPNRGWTDATTFQKVGFTISSIALGIAGNANPEQWLNRYIDTDIAKQREQATKAQSNVGNAQSAADARTNLYQRTLSAVGDQRVAADVVRIARIDQITADLKARLSQAGVVQMSAEQERLLTKLEEDKAAAQMRVQSQAANNPKTFTRTAYVHGKYERQGMVAAGKGLIDSGVSATERADAQEADLEKIDYKGRADALAEKEKAAAKRGDKMAAKAYAFGKDTAVAQVVLGGIDELLAMDDMPGYGYTEGVETPGKMTTDSKIDAVLESLGRLQSQGAITTDELNNFGRMVYKGVKLGDGSVFEGSESRLRENLGIVRKMVERKVAAHERGLDPEARAYYNRVAGADFEERWTGGGDESVVEED